jgi:glutamate 5-kinase
MSSAASILPSPVVVKVGASVLTDAVGRLIPERIEQLVRQVGACAKARQQPLLVTSGAIACGMAALKIAKRPKALAQLQAAAAVGQSTLMHVYAEAFGRLGLTTAQVLLTQEDLSHRQRFSNAKRTLQTLLERGVVPIINENDTVAVEEIAFGDNDRLAALVASAVEAQLLVLLSDVDGLMEHGKVVERVEGVGSRHFKAVQATLRQTTTGGMESKLQAARIVGHNGIPMVIANGTHPTVLEDLLQGKPVGTLFVPPKSRLSPRKWWIAFSLRTPMGRLQIDSGASRALLEQGKSLLSSGINQVQGRFERGDCVAIIDGQGAELARGIARYASSELSRINGLRSDEAAKVLGVGKVKEVVHRDQLVLIREIEHAHP